MIFYFIFSELSVSNKTRKMSIKIYKAYLSII